MRSNAGKTSSWLKECQKKEKQLKTFKKEASRTKELLLLEQSNCQQAILSGRNFEDSYEEITRRLPEIEAKVIRQTPVSANYLILKQQKANHEVIVLCFVEQVYVVREMFSVIKPRAREW